MSRRTLLSLAMASTLLVTGSLLTTSPVSAQSIDGRSRGRSAEVVVGGGKVVVGGTVATPTTYTAAGLAALPQVTVTSGRAAGHPGSFTGVSLLALANLSSPILGSGKNPQLRMTVTVTGSRGRTVTVAAGELDASFGNHPALLVADERGRRDDIDLIVPGDRTGLRSVHDVRQVTVSVSAAGAVSVAPGTVQLSTGRRTVNLSAALLAHLPQRTLTVTFLAGTASQTHTETGPPLPAVLLAAGVLPLPGVSVTAVGSDGYGATVTVGETLFGGRPLLLSLTEDGTPLTQPRLVPDGDVKGGRYVSGVVALSVSR